MAEDQIRSIIEGIRTRFQTDLETQLGAIHGSHEQAIAAAREAAEATAEQRWAAKMDEMRLQLTGRMHAEIAAARSEAERTMAAESARVRTEVEQAAAEAAAKARREFEETLVLEREDAKADGAAAARAEIEQTVAEERERAKAAADAAARIEIDRAVAAEREHAKTAADTAARAEIEQTVAAERERAKTSADAAARIEIDRAVSAERERAKTAADTAARAEIEQTVAAERERAKTYADAAARIEIDRAVAAERERARTAADTAARAEIEQTVAAERERAKAAADAAARIEIDRAVAAERERAEQTIAREHQRTAHELTEARAALDAARDSAMRDIEEARIAAAASTVQPAPAGARNTAGLLKAVRAIDEAPSLSDALAAAVRGAAVDAPRVVLFIVNGPHLQEWPVEGIPALHAAPFLSDSPEAGLIGEALRRNETLRSGRHGAPSAPAFAALPPNRTAVAVPLVLTGCAVAVLYADEGPSGDGSSDWQDTVQILGRHASACIAYLTATRTAQAAQMMMGAPEGAHLARADDEDAQGARRYARLLVSEIKLYNEAAVQQGRERRDLLSRLKPEIERARRMYDERVAPSVHARASLFQQELLQTLADGDRSLLG